MLLTCIEVGEPLCERSAEGTAMTCLIPRATSYLGLLHMQFGRMSCLGQPLISSIDRRQIKGGFGSDEFCTVRATVL